MPASLKEIAFFFLKLGSLSFGGPAVHIAMMEEEVVRRRKWLSHEHFADLIGATNLIPGPNSTEMAMHCGHEKQGLKGLIVAGMCFIFPAVLITSLLAWAYKEYGELPEVAPFIYGVKPAIISVILTSVFYLGRTVIKNVELGIMALTAATLCVVGVNDIAVLFGTGLYGIVSYGVRKNRAGKSLIIPFVSIQNGEAPSYAALTIFWTFLKVGAILYGSGYVLFAFLDQELGTTGLMSRQQLADAVAGGQITPGPVFSAATFVGWQLGGYEGAIAATIGIFLPSFLFVAWLNPLIPKLRRSPVMSAFLDAINAGSIAVIAAVCWDMGKETITDWRAIVIALLSLGLGLIFKRLNSSVVVIGGAALGYILKLF